MHFYTKKNEMKKWKKIQLMSIETLKVRFFNKQQKINLNWVGLKKNGLKIELFYFGWYVIWQLTLTTQSIFFNFLISIMKAIMLLLEWDYDLKMLNN